MEHSLFVHSWSTGPAMVASRSFLQLDMERGFSPPDKRSRKTEISLLTKPKVLGILNYFIITIFTCFAVLSGLGHIVAFSAKLTQVFKWKSSMSLWVSFPTRCYLSARRKISTLSLHCTALHCTCTALYCTKPKSAKENFF